MNTDSTLSREQCDMPETGSGVWYWRPTGGTTAGNEKPKDLRTLTPWNIIAELDLTSVKELRKK